MFEESSILNPVGQARVSAFFTQVYGWMAAALCASGAVAWYTVSSGLLEKIMTTNPSLLSYAMIGELVLVISLSFLLKRLSFPMAALMFLAYSVFTGFTLSMLFLVYTSASIVSTFLLTAAMFAGLALYGFSTSRNLAPLGGFLIMSLFGMILASVVNIFLHSPMIDWIVNYGGILVFSGLIAYDNQKLKAMCLTSDDESLGKLAIFGALTLYLDFINLFIRLLNVSGKRR